MDYLIRFLLGGTAVMVSYLITVFSPWKLLAGIFAAFPAVMLTAVLMVGLASGSHKASNTAKGSVFGQMGGVVCVITVLTTLHLTNNWALSILLGLVLWLGSSITISVIKEKAVNFRSSDLLKKKLIVSKK
jgi:hypothetical protein